MSSRVFFKTQHLPCCKDVVLPCHDSRILRKACIYVSVGIYILNFVYMDSHVVFIVIFLCSPTWWELWCLLDIVDKVVDHRQVRDNHWCPKAKTRRKRFIYTNLGGDVHDGSKNETFWIGRRCEYTQSLLLFEAG